MGIPFQAIEAVRSPAAALNSFWSALLETIGNFQFSVFKMVPFVYLRFRVRAKMNMNLSHATNTSAVVNRRSKEEEGEEEEANNLKYAQSHW